jgi:hypothetical protein
MIVHRDMRRPACVRAVIDWVKALFAGVVLASKGSHASSRAP